MGQVHQKHYSKTAMALHWTSALLLVGLLSVGAVMTRLPDHEFMLKFELYQLHKSVGITLFVLVLLRLGWRLGHKPPALLLPVWQTRLAAIVHTALYALMIVMPLVGWAMVSASPLGIPTLLYDLVPLPHLAFFESLADKKTAEATLKQIHSALAGVLALLAGSHVVAALWHQFIQKDRLIHRMLPTRDPADANAGTKSAAGGD